MIEKNEQSSMSIYEKLTRMQNELLGISIEKSGQNKFAGYKYYELDDLLPPVLSLCQKYECTLLFNFPSDKGELSLINWNDKEDEITIEVPFPELEKLMKMNYVQSSGTYQTYLKRYLLLHMFGIVEDEIIDSMNPDDNTSTQSSVKGIEKRPKVVSKVIKRCHEEYSEEECDNKLLNKVSMKMFKSGEITKEERKEIYEYLQKHK